MEAPNKLFIKPEKIKVEMIPGGELPNVGVQYIRKDLLLEWANEKHSLCKKRILEGVPGFEYKLCAYEQLIDKLNSL